MPGNAPLGILDIHSGFCTKNRDQGSIQKGRSYPAIFVAKEVVDFLTVLAIEYLALMRRTFPLPGSDGLSHVTRDPDPEGASILARRNVQIENLSDGFVLHGHHVLLIDIGRSESLHWETVFIKHRFVPILSKTLKPEPGDLVWSTGCRHPDQTQGSVKAKGIANTCRQIALGKGCSGNGKSGPDSQVNITRGNRLLRAFNLSGGG